MSIPLVKNHRGLSLIEVLVALGIGSIVVVGIASMMSLLNTNSRAQNLNQTRNEIIVRIRNQALNFDNLKASARLTKSLGLNGIAPDIESPNDIRFFEMLAKCMPEVTEGDASGCDKSTKDAIGKGFKFYLADSLSADPNRAVAGEDVF